MDPRLKVAAPKCFLVPPCCARQPTPSSLQHPSFAAPAFWLGCQQSVMFYGFSPSSYFRIGSMIAGAFAPGRKPCNESSPAHQRRNFHYCKVPPRYDGIGGHLPGVGICTASQSPWCPRRGGPPFFVTRQIAPHIYCSSEARTGEPDHSGSGQQTRTNKRPPQLGRPVLTPFLTRVRARLLESYGVIATASMAMTFAVGLAFVTRSVCAPAAYVGVL